MPDGFALCVEPLNFSQRSFSTAIVSYSSGKVNILQAHLSQEPTWEECRLNILKHEKSSIARSDFFLCSAFFFFSNLAQNDLTMTFPWLFNTSFAHHENIIQDTFGLYLSWKLGEIFLWSSSSTGETHGILLHLQERREELKEPPSLTASLIGSKVPVVLKCWLLVLRKYYLPSSTFSDIILLNCSSYDVSYNLVHKVIMLFKSQ